MKIMFRDVFKSTEWVTIPFKGIELEVKIHIPDFVQATNDQPAEGGLEDVEIIKVEYKGENYTNLFNASELLNEIVEYIIENYENF